MRTEKIYYSVSTQNEKVWIHADSCQIIDGCLAFYDIEGDTKVLIAAFPAGYWKFIFEADEDTGESINAQIPFWKRHVKYDVDNKPEFRTEYRPKKPYMPKTV